MIAWSLRSERGDLATSYQDAIMIWFIVEGNEFCRKFHKVCGKFWNSERKFVHILQQWSFEKVIHWKHKIWSMCFGVVNFEKHPIRMSVNNVHKYLHLKLDHMLTVENWTFSRSGINFIESLLSFCIHCFELEIIQKLMIYNSSERLWSNSTNMNSLEALPEMIRRNRVGCLSAAELDDCDCGRPVGHQQPFRVSVTMFRSCFAVQRFERYNV